MSQLRRYGQFMDEAVKADEAAVVEEAGVIGEAASADGAATAKEAAMSNDAATARDAALGREAANVLRRLDRIDALGREQVPPPGALLGELRALVREAEAWARLEGDARAASAVEKLREGAEGMS